MSRQAITSESEQRMAHLLGTALEACEALTVILGEEQHCIAAAEGDALPALVQRKLELLQLIEQQEQLRRHLLGSDSAADDAAMQDFLADCVEARELGERWQALLQRLRRLHAVNEANGALINRSLHQAETTLGVLTGRDRGQQDVYEAGGQRPGYGPGRELSRA